MRNILKTTDIDLGLNAFLLIGQSNMAGRRNLDEVSKIEKSSIFMFRDGQWVQAREYLKLIKQ